MILFRFAALAALVAFTALPWATRAQTSDLARYKAEAARVTITRDDWGIAHIHGRSDADAVFGMIYAQCEDDFNRVEANYLTSLGRTAEAEGETKIWQDLRQRLFLDPEDLKGDYTQSPDWLKLLMSSWADGLNFYLLQHPEVKPRVITHFEPWMALSFTEGSIGGDIERVDLKKLQDFYSVTHIHVRANSSQANPTQPPRAPFIALLSRAMSGPTTAAPLLSSRSEAEGPASPFIADPDPAADGEPRGSNGIAISPANTVNHHALLLINPHTSFFFRSELQMSSDAGLNAYGAVTWGQFFIYQGFNERAGWMHTSSGVDAVDEFEETITGDNSFSYKYGSEDRPFTTKAVTISYKTPAGQSQKTFTTYYSTHGPVTHETNSKWVTMKLMNIPIEALEQSYLRTKAHSYSEYLKTMELQANSSNNTLFADSDGDIAYWHGNFIPKRETRFDFTRPVDGSDPATDWHGLMSVDEAPHLHNPASGFVFNVNNSPWSGSGPSSLRKADFPAYVESGIESARGEHAAMLLNGRKDFTLDSLLASAFDSFLPWFTKPIAALTKAWDGLSADNPLKQSTAPQVALLRTWNQRWAADSTATSLAVFWGTALLRDFAADARRAATPSDQYIVAHASGDQLLADLQSVAAKLAADFGSWQTPWGEINRFQRLTGDIVQPFSDSAPSVPVPFTSSAWGSLASFGARQYPGTKRWYGTSGNSFVAVVEFGPRIHARAVTAGGESGHPSSPHFTDEVPRYSSGNLREVYFYPDQLKGHTERTYHPGDSAGLP